MKKLASGIRIGALAVARREAHRLHAYHEAEKSSAVLVSRQARTTYGYKVPRLRCPDAMIAEVAL